MYIQVSASVSYSNNAPVFRYPGIDSGPAVYGVVKRVEENQDEAHTNQQVCTVYCTHIYCILHPQVAKYIHS